MSFTWADVRHAYLEHPYNDTASNERCVEIPAAQWFLAGRQGEGLEVGNVLGHYGEHKTRRVVDLYEQGEGVENIDVRKVEGTFDWIVSVSTLEHVGWDIERDRDAALDAIAHLRCLLADDGRLFLTIPLGHHPALDQAIKDGTLDPIVEALYVHDHGDWVPAERGEWRPYDHDAHRANVVWIAELAQHETKEGD